jgi:cell division protein FtsL
MGARYSRQTGYTITRKTNRPTVRTVSRRVKLGPTTAKLFALAALAIIAIVMVSQSSNRATNTYTQNSLHQEEAQLDQDISRLRLEASKAQSLQAIQQTPVKDQMTPAGTVQYLEKGNVAGASTDATPTP